MASSKDRNAILRNTFFDLQQEAALKGIPLSTGGIDLSTGKRPSFKLGPFEFGDSTDYESENAELLKGISEIGEAARAQQQEREEKRRAQTAELLAPIMSGQGVPSLEEAGQVIVDVEKQMGPLQREQMRFATDEAIRQSQAQLAAAFPYLNEAARVGIERNLDASQRFLEFKESMPTAVQNRMLASSTAYAQNLQGVATAANAAANMVKQPRRFG